jgi:hypothetical protein
MARPVRDLYILLSHGAAKISRRESHHYNVSIIFCHRNCLSAKCMMPDVNYEQNSRAEIKSIFSTAVIIKIPQ